MDSSVLEDIKFGDEKAFENVFQQFYEVLCSHAYNLLRDGDDAEEMVQNVFVKFWNKKDHVIITTSLKSYLFQSVKNECLNFIKHKQVVREHVTESLHAKPDAPSDTVVVAELQKKIEDVLEGIPPERKKIFLMNRNDGLKYREIAVKLNISIKTVENQMGKALKYLRSELAEYMSVGLLIVIKWINNF